MSRERDRQRKRQREEAGQIALRLVKKTEYTCIHVSTVHRLEPAPEEEQSKAGPVPRGR